MSDIDSRLPLLLKLTEDLALELGGADDELSTRVGARLHDSVIRPLRERHADSAAAVDAVDSDGIDQTPVGSSTADERLWSLAQMATKLLIEAPGAAELGEAVAALQDIAVASGGSESDTERRLAELSALQADLMRRIVVSPNGPYLVTNAAAIRDRLGQPLPARPQMALCRCGESQIKPLCDGTHASIGFTDTKDPKRVPDRHDTYVGQQVTILDNRGICQHSGLCTDRLMTVFHAGDEPFVTPSGARMDDIIRAVRDCPSGALSYAVDGVEARAAVDYHGTREPVIEVSGDGPYRISGGVPLVGPDGGDVARNEGASLEHYALCRCGHSQNKPFCSGMHFYVEFRDPVAEADHDPTIFEWAGGLPALLRMTRLFYGNFVPQDPLLSPLFAKMSPDHPERVAAWLAEVFCGPHGYSEQFGGYPHMISQHLGKCLTEEQRARWVTLLLASAQGAGLPNDAEFRSAFGAYLEWGSRLAVENSQTGARPPEHMPMPRWDWNTAAGAPGSRASALAPGSTAEAEEAALPTADEPLSFERHIKPLFRQRDRQSMKFAFDLWSLEDVSGHADAILDRLQAGTMPCDGAWPKAKVDVFRRWVASDRPA